MCFQIKMGNDFPESSPEVNCDTEIYHPNIDPTSESYNVCLSLFDEWTPSYGIRDVIQGLLFLFYNPNVDDPLSTYFGDCLTDEEFEANVRAFLRGEDVEDYSFPWNYHGNDPEMLKHKAKKEDKVETETPAGVTNEVEKESVINVENAANNEDRTEDVKEELKEEKLENAESVENKEEETDRIDGTEVNEEPKVQDITVILEKVSELMLQYPEKEEEKKEDKEDKEGTREETKTEIVSDDAEGATNFVNSDSTEADTSTINHEINPTGATENTDTNAENDNAVIDCALQRQTSKIERQCSIKEVTAEVPAVTQNPADDTCSNHSRPISHYIDASSTYATPGFDLATNMFGAACYFVYKSFVK